MADRRWSNRRTNLARPRQSPQHYASQFTYKGEAGATVARIRSHVAGIGPSVARHGVEASQRRCRSLLTSLIEPPNSQILREEARWRYLAYDPDRARSALCRYATDRLPRCHRRIGQRSDKTVVVELAGSNPQHPALGSSVTGRMMPPRSFSTLFSSSVVAACCCVRCCWLSANSFSCVSVVSCSHLWWFAVGRMVQQLLAQWLA